MLVRIYSDKKDGQHKVLYNLTFGTYFEYRIFYAYLSEGREIPEVAFINCGRIKSELNFSNVFSNFKKIGELSGNELIKIAILEKKVAYLIGKKTAVENILADWRAGTKCEQDWRESLGEVNATYRNIKRDFLSLRI